MKKNAAIFFIFGSLYCLIDTESHKESKNISDNVFNRPCETNINYHF